jgi:hypothetical protein
MPLYIFFATACKICATIVAFNAKKVAYQCHDKFIFATYLNGGKIFAGREARCPRAGTPHVGYAYTV